MAVDCVCAQANELGVPLCELRLELCEGAELGGADGSVVFGVGKEDDPAVNVSDNAGVTWMFWRIPAVADEVMEFDRAVGSVGLEVGRGVTKTELGSHVAEVLRCWCMDCKLSAQ